MLKSNAPSKKKTRSASTNDETISASTNDVSQFHDVSQFPIRENPPKIIAGGIGGGTVCE